MLSSSQPPPPPAQDEGHTNLFLGNIPYAFSLADLERLAEKFGRIRNVNMPIDRETRKNKGFAFVEFAEPKEAREFYEYLQRETVDGRMLKVDYDEGLAKKEKRLRERGDDRRYDDRRDRDRYDRRDDRYGGRDDRYNDRYGRDDRRDDRYGRDNRYNDRYGRDDRRDDRYGRDDRRSDDRDERRRY